jgi:glycosyltransferase involved in cell wall biosynthesis
MGGRFLVKVLIWPSFSSQDRGEGGIRRVVEALHRYLSDYDIEIVKDIRQADLVNVHADEYKTDLPIAASLHGLYWGEYEWAEWCYEANRRLIGVAKRAESVSVPSQWVHNSFARGMLLDPFVLYHGIHPEEWETVEPNGGYVFWGKTRKDPICTPAPLEELAKLSPQTKFVTTFGGEDLPNVSRTGKIAYEQSRQAIARSGVYLATVLETGGITVLEAMAAGVPVLGFDWGVNPELVAHKETGYLVPPGDYEALKEGLDYCLANRKRLGEAAREHVLKNYRWQDRVGDYIPFFKAALDEKKRYPIKVSVVVTAHNLERYLPACLDSLLAQEKFEDWECIVIDDASPDRCGEIADGYTSIDPRFRVIHNTKNRYLAEARNVGIRVARGQYILALDADDELGPRALRVLSEALDQNKNLDIVTGAFELIEPDGRHWISTWPPQKPTFDDQVRKHNQVPYASMYRRRLWERVGGYRRRCKTAEDADNWLRLMSYGAVPARVTDAPTLVYNNRPNSMSHSIPEPDWTAWFPWSRIKTLTPFGAVATSSNPGYSHYVHAYGPPEISVVIPCGPGHDFYLQDALDSLQAQTFLNWEAIVINDTGHSWFSEQGELVNPYLAGFPFVRVLEPEDGKSHGVAHARNLGIATSTASVFVLLDADDYMQPLMLDALYKVYKKYGGYVYSDWLDQDGQVKEAQSWAASRLLDKMLGPSTGLYSKADWKLVGGFDEKIHFWEDWDLQLSLLEHDICGSRVAQPLFTYRYNTGRRREDAFASKEKALAEIRAKHKKFIEQGC